MCMHMFMIAILHVPVSQTLRGSIKPANPLLPPYLSPVSSLPSTLPEKELKPCCSWASAACIGRGPILHTLFIGSSVLIFLAIVGNIGIGFDVVHSSFFC